MRYPEAFRHDHPFVPLTPNDPEGGFFKVPHFAIEDYYLSCLALEGQGWERVAVTVHRSGALSDRCPTWEEMCFVKFIFWEDEEAVMQLHPPRSEWVNNHPYCLWLWRPIGVSIPLPPSILVGIKG